MVPVLAVVKAEIDGGGSGNEDYRNLWRWRGIKGEEQLKGGLFLWGEVLVCCFSGDRFPW